MSIMTRRNFSSLPSMGLLVILALGGAIVQVADATMVYLATANMDLSMETNWMYDAKGLYSLESTTATYVKDILEAEVDVLHVDIAVGNQFKLGNGSVVETKVTLVYLATDASLQLPVLLQNKTDTNALAAILQLSTLNVVYGEVKGTQEVQEVDGTSPDTALLSITIALSVTLALLASVMLFVTGGCSSCLRCFSKICFEEIVDEPEPHKAIKEQRTYPEYDEERSIAESSVAGTAASGILGAISNDEGTNPAFGLGIKSMMGDQSNITGSEFDDESELGDLGDTPYSHKTERSTNTAPLGITSMRKLIPDTPDTNAEDVSKNNQEEMQGRMSHMIMGRFNGGKK